MKLSKSNYQTHIYFISLIAIHYFVSIIFFNRVIIEPHDNLDILVVYDHIIAEIYKGNFEKINYFLSGEIKWYYFEKLFYPINVLHYFLDDKVFYFTNDILKKLFAYFSFYLLAQSLKLSKFNSALGGVLYATFIYIKMPVGFGLSFLPYILYLLLNKEKLNIKHYFFLFLIGLNSSLIQDFFSFILLIPLSFLIKYERKNLNIYLQVFCVILLASILSNIHLIAGSIFGETIHRTVWDFKSKSFFESFLLSFKSLFFINFTNSSFIFHIPIAVLSSILIIFSFFSKLRNIKLIFFFVFLILFFKSILNYNFVDNIFIGVFDILKGYNFSRIDRIIPLIYTILLVLLISNSKSKKIKNIFYILSFVSILAIQLKVPITVVSKEFIKQRMSTEKFVLSKDYFFNKSYIKFLGLVLNKENYIKNNTIFENISNNTFGGYYKFEDYGFLKTIVKNARVMSVGLDPMIAVMNDIKVIDGYHTMYPLSYKIKFRKIIEEELEKNIIYKNYYDKWGSRVYAFFSDKNNITLNFNSAKKLSAEYVISSFPIKNEELKIICYQCNNAKNIFLYKIL